MVSGLFPSSANVSGSGQSHGDADQDEANEQKHELESLKLELAPSTLEAIFAVQTHRLENHASQSCSKRDKSLRDQSPTEKHPTSPEHIPSKRKMETEGDQDYSDGDSKKRKKSKRKKKKKKKKKSHSRSLSPERFTVTDIHTSAKNKVFLEDIPNLSPKDAFRLDRKSNKDLLHYKCVSKFHLAKYNLVRNLCLGSSEMPLPYSGNNQKFIKKKDKTRRESRYFSRKNFKQSWGKGFSFVTKPRGAKLDAPSDFISIPKATGDVNWSNSLGSYSCLDEATALYAEGKGLQEEENTLNKDSFVMDEIFERVAKLNRQTREDPTNIKLWLKFVNFQDELARMDKGFKYTALSLRDVFQPPRSVTEKKITILEKAIELNPSSLELKKAQLELYEDIWESDELERAWENLLFIHASDVDLWCHYLMRQQTRLSTFTFSRVVKKYHRCFKTLIPILEGQVKVIKKSENLEDKLIGLFYQYCNFLHQCGYTERAVATFQAMLEFNLFCPPSLNLQPSNERKSRFEAFWESNAPRFGDAQAKGWAKWEETKECATMTSSSSSLNLTDALEDSILKENLSRHQTWLKIENGRQEAHCLTWKPDETKGEQEEDCEDPDRIVLFEDISPALFRLCKSDNCVKMVCLFLSFLGLNSTYLSKVFHDLDEVVFTQHVLDKMHQVPHLSSLSCGLNVAVKWTPHNCLITFIRGVIEQAEAFFSSTTRVLFTLLRLDLELKKTGAIHTQELSKSASKEIKKVGKNMLKESQNRNNLIVWDSFIRLSWAVSEKMEETASMVDIALGMFLDSSALSKSDSLKSVGVLLLCRTFSQIMLNFEPLEHVKMKGRRTSPNSEDKLQVMGCLGALVDGSKFKPHTTVDMSPARMLKTRKRYEALLQQYMADSCSGTSMYTHDKLVTLVECWSLFEYCASNFQGANEIFTRVEHLVKFSNENGYSATLKELYVAHLSFIMNVMGIDSISLSHLRTVLNEALIDFPCEFYFYFIFLEIESGSYIAGRLRTFYEKHLKRSGNMSITLFAVLSEVIRHDSVRKTLDLNDVMQTGLSDSGVLHRIRMLFEHCLHPEVGGHCPLLWRLALAFEESQGNVNRAKGILYRALQNCPWSKSIYMDGVDLFGGVELLEMNDLMTEKEIRVRIPLEEVDLLLTADKESDEDCDASEETNLLTDDADHTSLTE